MSLKLATLFFGETRDLVGKKLIFVEIPSKTCKFPDFLNALNKITDMKLAEKLLLDGAGGAVSLAPGYKVMLNKRILSLKEAVDVVLKDTDEIGILPPFSGG